MASTPFNINSGWSSEWISATVGGQIHLYMNKAARLAIISYNSQTTASDGTFTLPNWVIPAVSIYGTLRHGGYLSVTADSNQGTIVNSTAYSVGQIIFPIR
jgi:hypothetical protein